MGEVTKIAWTDHTFNPWIGCQRVSPACTHCYAEWFVTNRMGKDAWGNAPRILTTGPWREVVKWNRQAEIDGVRRRVFCASLADIFEDWQGAIVDTKGRRLYVERAAPHAGYIPETPQGSFTNCRPATMADLRADVFRLIDSTSHLDWLLLTKRPENVKRMWPTVAGWTLKKPGEFGHRNELMARSNVWLGTTVESSKYLSRLDHILETPAPVHFASVEPQFEDIDFTGYLGPTRINWLITGGESKQGKDHEPQPYYIEWARSIIRQCRDAGVAPFVKQIGSAPWLTTSDYGVPVGPLKARHPKGEEPSEWPAEIRVRQFPNPEA